MIDICTFFKTYMSAVLPRVKALMLEKGVIWQKAYPSLLHRLLNLAAHRKRQKVDILTPESTSGSVADPTQASMLAFFFPN